LSAQCSNKKRFHHQALVEIRILDHLRRRDKDGLHNVIHMLDYFYFRSHLCISFELLRSVPRPFELRSPAAASHFRRWTAPRRLRHKMRNFFFRDKVKGEAS
jgi:hypothetical protein